MPRQLQVVLKLSSKSRPIGPRGTRIWTFSARSARFALIFARVPGGDARAPADAGLSRDQNRVGVVAVTLPLVPEHDPLTFGHLAARTGLSSAARCVLTENRPFFAEKCATWTNFRETSFQTSFKFRESWVPRQLQVVEIY